VAPLSNVSFELNKSTPGINPDQITGLPLVIGVASEAAAGGFYAVGRETDLDTVIGQGPVRDFVDDHLAEYEGNLPYILLGIVEAVNTGTVTMTSTATGSAAMTVNATQADMDADILVKCSKAGGSGVGKVDISLDGGTSWDVLNKTIGAADLPIPDAGVSASITGGAMALGDTWALKAAAPTCTLASVMSMIDEAGEKGYWPEYVAVPQVTAKTDWQTMGAKADEMFASKRPMWFLTKGAAPTTISAADLQTWMNTAVAESDDWSHPFVVVNQTWAEIAETNGRHRVRNTVGIQSGLHAKDQVNFSIGWRGRHPLPRVTLPEHYTDAIANTLSNSRYTVIRRRLKPRNPVFDKALTMADDTSKFTRVESVRTVMKAIRLMEEQVEPYLESPAWQRAGQQGKSSDTEAGVQAILNAMKKGLDTMVTKQPFSELDNYKLSVPSEGQDLAGPNGLFIKAELFGIPNIGSIIVGVHFSWQEWRVELIEEA